MLGGNGNPRDWVVEESNVQPIGIELARLSELLRPEVFRLRMPHAELAKRQKLLEYALWNYIGSRVDDVREEDDGRDDWNDIGNDDYLCRNAYH